MEHFKMERMQSRWENYVDYNLSESGVHPLSVRELVPEEEWEEVLATRLGYLQTNGTPELRESISHLYEGAGIENVLVTTGSAEANYLLAWSQVEPGDDVLLMLPNYMQLWGLIRGFGGRVIPFWLEEKHDWNPDLNKIERLVTQKTKIICITNPNNPTGSQLSPEARKTLIEMAASVDAWIFSDEVYQGAELDRQITPSFWGTYPKVAVTCGLSKAYGLPGLRTGWILAPASLIETVWPYHDYITISLSAVSDYLAQKALEPSTREKILRRTRKILQTNLLILTSWMDRQKGLFECVPPKAGAIAFPRYTLNMNSTALVDRIRETKSVLLVPGDHFEMDGFLRIGYGDQEEHLRMALSRVEEALAEFKA
ncbi:MAG: aminotransferase class I/II-fold pyridoxal phosphate-dependent enzyme [Candidatus Aminicenantales bacterium]